jgi:hypothetical protein
MKRILALAALAVAGFVVPANAHHSFAMFEMQKEVVYSGTVMEFTWENPHSHIIIKVAPGAKDPSTVGNWDIEGAGVNIMSRQGWTKSMYKVGDPIILVAHPLKSGEKGASLFCIVRPDGTRVYQDIARPTPEQEKIIEQQLADLKS